jgi:arginine decarboxylase
MERWSPKKSSELYQVENWNAGYFQVNEKGNLEATPHSENPAIKVDLKELVDDLTARGIRAPILLRFSDIVKSRIQSLNSAFASAIESYEYKGRYRGVFPIKVNQQRFLVEDIIKHGRSVGLGLEAGSKPELLITLALLQDSEGLIICNGFKDKDYVETALLSQKLGRNTIIVVDRYSEIPLIMNCAQELGIKPRIGFRAKLESRGTGKWSESSGIKSKFGLNSAEIVLGLEYLKKQNALDCLELLHFHLGSQVSALRAIKDSLIEASTIYAELVSMGAGLKILDVGGGLGVDYDGSQTNSENSINYSVKEYASDVVWQIQQVCDQKKVPHPDIVTEAGRYLSAHHSALIFNVVGVNKVKTDQLPCLKQANSENDVLLRMKELCESLNRKNLNEHIQDAFKYRDDAYSLFNLGYLNLYERACMETLFRFFCTKALKVIDTVPKDVEEADLLRKFLIDSYFCNFSLFQSAPDSWAVDQLFPIMPIHRLEEKPTRSGILLDLSCDSDGKIDKFIDQKDDKDYLPLHDFKESEPYYLGMFLIGAYQEILGDLHNLFGDTDAVHITVRDSGYSIDHVLQGDNTNEVLGYVGYERSQLIRLVRESIEKSLSKKQISLYESRLLIRHFEEGLNSYTYLKSEAIDDEQPAIESFRKIGKIQDNSHRQQDVIE